MAPSFIHFLSFLALILIVSGQTEYKSTSLSPLNVGYDGAAYSWSSDYVSDFYSENDGGGLGVFSNEWYINTTAAIGSDDWYSQFDIAFSLNSSWGFHPSKESTLSFTINGLSPTGGVDNSNLIVTFSENKSKWFSILLAIDHDRSNFLYPSCPEDIPDDLICLPYGLESGDVYAQVASANGNRSVLFGGNTFDTATLGIFEPSGFAVEWPLTITMENDPEFDFMRVSLSADATINQSSFRYSSSFEGGHGLDIYLSMNSPNDAPIIIGSVDFEYSPDGVTL